MFQRKCPFPSIEQITRITVLKKTFYWVLKCRSTECKSEWLTFRDILIQSLYSYIDRNRYAMYTFYLFLFAGTSKKDDKDTISIHLTIDRIYLWYV